MSWWQHLWQRLKAIPLGVWAAFGAALTLLFLYLRGQRLEGELVKAQVQLRGAQAKADLARERGRADVHLEKARTHAEKVEALEKKRELIREAGVDERKRLRALPPEKMEDEYFRLAEEKAKRKFDQ